MRRQSGNALAALQQSIDRPKRFPDNLLHAHEAAPNALLRKLEDRSLGIAKHFLRRIGLVGRPRNRRIRCMDQPAQQRLVAHNFDVVLNARPVWHAIQQARYVTHIADRLQILVPIQFLDQRDHVDRPRRFRQVDHARINPPVRVERKILDPQMLRRLVIRKIIQQNRAQNRALRFYIRGKSADAVISGRHVLDISSTLKNANRTLPGRGL